MDVSALPYFYAFVVDFLLLLIIGFVQWRQRRTLLEFALAWLTVDATRHFVIILSAGEHGALDRDTIVWLIRGLVFVQYSIALGSLFPFLTENTTMGTKSTKGEMKPDARQNETN